MSNISDTLNRQKRFLDELNHPAIPQPIDPISLEPEDTLIGPQIKALEEIAVTTRKQADIAIKTSKKADVKGWIAVITAVFSLVLEFIINYDEISLFIGQVFTWLK